jgi:hypothetical protein
MEGIGTTIAKDLITKIVIVVVVVLLGYLLIVRPILQKIGIVKTSEDKKREEETKTLGTSVSSPFSPTYYKQQSKAVILDNADTLAKQIHGAIGYIYDDENSVYGALRQLTTKTQLSFLADTFTKKYSEDLYQYLRRNLSDDEMDVVNSIASSLK